MSEDVNWITKFFLICSGADLSLLKLEKCRSDRTKYVGIGALILCVGILAGLASGYAFYMVFNPNPEEYNFTALVWSIVFGVFWGLMIFNLDRFLVSTLKKEPPKETFTEQMKSLASIIFFKASPRIVLAVMLAFVISKPLEMRIFQSEVVAKIPTIRAKKSAKNKNVTKEANNQQVADTKAQIKQIEKDLEQYCGNVANLKKKVKDEDEKGLQGRKPGPGPAWEKYVEDAKVAEEKCEEEKDKSTLDEKKLKLKSLEQSSLTTIQQSDEETKKLDGLATRLEALAAVSEEDLFVGIAGWFIFVIILLFEISPIFSKIIAPYGPYDMVLDRQEEIVLDGIEEERIKQQERIKRLTELGTERTNALKKIQEDLLSNIDVEDSNVTVAEFNHYKRELLKQALSELSSTINVSKKNKGK